MSLKNIIFYIIFILNLNLHAANNDRVLGDINDDGIINILDVVILVGIILD